MLDWIKTRTVTHPDKVAIIDPYKDTEWTFDQLNRRAENLANYLVEQGIKKGDRIGVFVPNDVSIFDFFFASIKMGAIFVPMNWRLKASEVAGVVEDAGIEHIYYATNHLERLELVPQEYIKLNVDEEEYNEIVNPDNYQPFDNCEISMDDIALLIYTSGSTGTPKGVTITHRGYINNIYQEIFSWNFGEEARTIVSTPLFHILGLIDSALAALKIGGTIILDRYFDMNRINYLIEEYKPNILIMIPTMYYGIMAGEGFNATELQKIDYLVQGGAPPLPKVNEIFSMMGLTLINGYGLTEAPLLTFNTNEIAEKYPYSIGHPVMNVEIKLIDEKGNSVKRGEIGEMIVKGENVTKGYWNKPKLNEEVFTSDGYFYTGDLARLGDDGEITIINRKKELIITGGENVLPSEVESILSKHPLIRQAIVVGFENKQFGESVSAAIVLNQEAMNVENYEAVLDEYCTKNLAGYKTPKLYLTMEEIPLNSVNKPDRLEIQRLMNEHATALGKN